MSKWLTWEQTRCQVAIAGRVTDAQMGRAIAGAQVTLSDGPAAFTAWLALQAKQYGALWEGLARRPDRTRTAADGYFHFMDLPAGEYTLNASRPGWGTRYGQAQVSVTVVHDVQGQITLATADLALPPTALQGQITSQKVDDENQPVLVALAEVKVLGSGERAFSDAQGDYLLSGLEAGQRTVRVSAQGHWPATQTVSLDRAQLRSSLDFALVPTTQPKPESPPRPRQAAAGHKMSK